MNLFQNSSGDMKLALKENLTNMKMEKGESIPKYFTKFTQCRDELGSGRVTVAEYYFVRHILLGFPKS